MSKFMLTAGLMLGSLIGGSVAARGDEMSQAESLCTGSIAIGYTDYGSYSRYTDAIPARNAWRAKGYGANIVSVGDYYTVRVFDR